MAFNDLVNEDLRLVILTALADAGGYTLNEAILRSILARFGHRASQDRLRMEISWLEEQGLIAVERSAAVWIASITPRGADVAAGDAQVPGVRRPSPAAPAGSWLER